MQDTYVVSYSTNQLMAGNAKNLEKSGNEKVTILAIRKYCLEVKLTSIELFS